MPAIDPYILCRIWAGVSSFTKKIVKLGRFFVIRAWLHYYTSAGADALTYFVAANCS
ncbi:hypothetical protein J2T15_000246 [Paenibacillus harenae]|uniref:Uncharacterized protein n=1 Tax=Paenibacillus harenae TaxID=306543 RepID=A0ABT9TWL1_PAEHA|nr:hypothetical protein [Paenibacillus harenae]MDQ0110830.1 hypothetical protein [Paenibacillus harenae]